MKQRAEHIDAWSWFARLVTLGMVVVVLAGCATKSPPGVRPPETPEELAAQRRMAPQAFTSRQIGAANLERVRDRRLRPADRVASLAVLAQVDGDNAEHYPALAGELERPGTPLEVRDAVLMVLARKDYEGIAPHVVPALIETPEEPLATALRDWLARHPRTVSLSPLVRAWADADPNDAVRQRRHADAVEAVTARPWRDALLEALNAPAFDSRGSAWEVLLNGTERAELVERLGVLPAGSSAVAALQYGADRLGYLPPGRQELLRLVTLFTTARARLDVAAVVVKDWSTAHDYSFHPRDLHLLGRLATDPTAAPPPGNLPAWLGRLGAADRVRVAVLLRWLSTGGNRERLTTLATLPEPEPRGGLIVFGAEGLTVIFYPSARARGFAPTDDMVQASQDCLAWMVVEPRPGQALPAAGAGIADPEARLRDCPGMIVLRREQELLVSYWTPVGPQRLDLARIPLGK